MGVLRLSREHESGPVDRVVAIGVAVVVTVLVVVVGGMDLLQFDVIMGVITLMVIAMLTVPLLRWVARREDDPGIVTVLLWAFGFKMVFTMIRYFFIAVVYGDNGDAGLYSSGGAILMEMYRHGNFVLEVPQLASRGAETNRIAVIVGLVYMITGVSRYAASFVFGWLCFLGQLLMYRAFRRAVPLGDSRRYAMLLFFLPSLLFWPSSLGKEAVMVFSIGVASYGAALLLCEKIRISGLGIFLLGVSGLFFVRPHMALIAIVSLALAGAVSAVSGFSSQRDKRASAKPFAIRMLALLVLLGASAFATTQVGKVLGTGEGPERDQGLTGVLERTKGQTAEGGSVFEPSAVTSPIDLPAAAVTVLFRPFPWEAHSLNSVIASGEGVLLVGLLVVGRRRLLTWAKALTRSPYLVYCLVFTLTFIIAFSYIANFGILARQRTQMLPLMLTAIAMPVLTRTRAPLFGGRRSAAVSNDAVSGAGGPLVAVEGRP